MRIAPVRVESVVQQLAYLGTAAPRYQVDLIAQVPGAIADLPVPEGGHAATGAPLVRIAAPDQAARLSRVRAERDRAHIERDHACTRYETDARLGRSGDLPGERVDLGRKGCEASTAAATAATAAHDEALAITARTVERAPFPGTVLRWLVAPGQDVMPGRPLLTYGSDALEVRILLSDRDRARVRPGQPVLVDLGDAVVRRTVTAVAPLAAGAARSVEVTVDLAPEDAAHVVPGVAVDVGFVVAEERAATTVPLRAVHGDRVYLVRGDQIVEHLVTLGAQAHGRVAVHPAPGPDDLVVVGGFDGLDPERAVWTVVDAEVAP